jgi:hypothetical protein
METKIKGKFVTRVLGGVPYLGYAEQFKSYLTGLVDKSTLSFAAQVQKKGESAEDAVYRILNVFNRDIDGKPVIGDWMLKAAIWETGGAVFNAMKNRNHPSRKAIETCVNDISPIHVGLFNGKRIEKATGILTAAVTLDKKGSSTFKAWEFIEAGATFEFTLNFDEELVAEEHMMRILEKMRLGASRKRYGAFELV